MSSKKLFHSSKVAQSRPILKVISVSQLSVQEARGEMLIEGEKLLSKFI
jgi:hypothetical protein